MVYIVLNIKRRMRSNIWPKTSQKTDNTKYMIKTIWNKEIIYQQKNNKTLNCLLSPTSKGARYVFVFFLICD